jgi:hypothetical protein
MRRVSLLLAAGFLFLAAAALPTIRASAQQEVVSDDNLDQMIENAKTPADHEALAAYYDQEAAANEEKAKIHHGTHHAYERFKIKPPDMGPHCDALAKYYQRVANEDKALAAGHRELAKKVGAETKQ